ncbi:MAG: transporter substrate-binding domain-containing protein [Desulfovibrio sp.]|nr:transporter substrate-binding domain-containing protein [Desulfovibrio sp.]
MNTPVRAILMASIRLRRALRGLCIVLAALLCLSAVVPAAETPRFKNPQKIVTVGYFKSLAYNEGDDTHPKSGYSYEYLQKIASYTGWRYEYVYGNWFNLYYRFIWGEIDIFPGLVKREDRKSEMLYPDSPMGHDRNYIYVRADDTSINPNDISSFSGKRVGAIRQTNMMNELVNWQKRTGADIEVISYPGFTLIEDLLDGKLDAISVAENNVSITSRLRPLIKIADTPVYLCVRHGRPDLLDDLNRAIAKMDEQAPFFKLELWNTYYKHTAADALLTPDEDQWVRDHGAITIGYIKNYMPFSDTPAAGGRPRGLVVDVMEQILDRLNLSDRLKVNYVPFNGWADMLPALKRGEVDAVFPVCKNLWYAESNGIAQTDSIITSPAMLIYKGAFTDAKTQSIALSPHDDMQTLYSQLTYPDSRRVEEPSASDCLDAVQKGKAGVTIFDTFMAKRHLKAPKNRSLNAMQMTESIPFCMGTNLGDAAIVSLLSRGVKQLDVTELTNAMYAYDTSQYGTPWQNMLEENLPWFSGILIAALLAVYAAFRAYFIASRRERESLEKAYAAAVAAKEQAEKASNAKTAFLNSSFHDIRTPMNAIMGFSNLAETHIDQKDLVKGYLKEIGTAGDHLLSLLNDVLDMSHIESGKISIREEKCALSQVLHNLCGIFQADIRRRRQNFHINVIDVTHENVFCDKLRLNQILMNCVSNAIKFTGPGGTVEVTVIEKNGAPEGHAAYDFIVRDTGIGISQKFIPHIFEPFSRENTATINGISGTGLGMSVTKNIVDKMNGSIDVQSQKGVGTTVTASLQFRLCDPDTGTQAVPKAADLLALVVETDARACDAMVRMFEAFNVRAEGATGKDDAVQKALGSRKHGRPFDLVLVSQGTLDAAELETVRAIHRELGTNTVIVLATPYDWGEIEKAAHAVGVTYFCVQPIFPSDLRELLLRVTGEMPDATRLAASDDLPKAPKNFANRRVLIVDDVKTNRDLAETILEEAGMEVICAENGKQAVEIMRGPDAAAIRVILMDIQMPVMDGYTASLAIRALPDRKIADVPIVAMTANAFEEDKQKAREAGMDAHLAKPFKVRDFYAVIDACLTKPEGKRGVLLAGTNRS